ncbi:MAG: dTDP-4-dehydrorhamnose 3,5-epimerase [Lachnospiraceae bacterium]|nr:dTDP-4-dehydrorhamnose 3,5-epimerase [Lachnospiraceae bacterium]MCM1239664.1 dTDP-4-dehydrorhamnose 3,5-epimerase [Lachnospiraceae bacterium]MCM1302694.1 dTDP-4-dehydrorhamnose 3,5-epimerase [Butyrivibrio sp.]MCM1342413.1 dTDP-4-dehydrorhamnose 3,5-epimerase [Muribaculaceae bacterium]MCM1410280.1 dTDP-4-dehydrorhamnose 3,5-epimerase [Lachnospiraceae bacterium]
MAGITFTETGLKDLRRIHPFIAGDERGSLVKTFEKQQYAKCGLAFETSEIMFSTSRKGVLRGLHFQTGAPQAKIVTVIKGEVWDVAVDLRKHSDTCGQWRGFYLSEENREGLYIPEGFAHGFLALRDDTVLMYQCKNVYLKENDTGIIWNDEKLGIQWPADQVDQVIISQRDQGFCGFSEFMDKYGGL